MKIRIGFVSNSSSSSFCILGFVLDDDNVPQEILDNYEDVSDLCWEYDREHEAHPLQLIESTRGISEYYDCNLIGASPNKMKDNQTLLDFKNEILKEIHTLGFTNITLKDLHWYTDGGYDN